jgi:hypothetical protein
VGVARAGGRLRGSEVSDENHVSGGIGWDVPAGVGGFAVMMAALVGALVLCPRPGPANAHIHWSAAVRTVSPDCRWAIAVTPLAGDSDAAVSLVNAATGAARVVFTLARDAWVHWAPDGRTLVIQHDEFSNHSHLMVFSPLDALPSDSVALEADRRMRADIERQIGPGVEIVEYFPRFVGFRGGAVVAAVEVATVAGETGPKTRRCFGYTITPDPVAFQARPGAICQ